MKLLWNKFSANLVEITSSLKLRLFMRIVTAIDLDKWYIVYSASKQNIELSTIVSNMQ